MSDTSKKPLRVCVEQVDGEFVAQCVDYDIAGGGATPQEAIDCFVRMYMKHFLVAAELGTNPLPAPPPADYEDRWARLTHRIDREIKRFTIPAFAIVEPGADLPADHSGQVEVSIPIAQAA